MSGEILGETVIAHVVADTQRIDILGLGQAGPQGPIGAAGPAGADGAQGPIGPAGPAGADGSWSVMPTPDDMDESGAAYFYFGWSDFGGGWLVRRQHRATGAHEDATTGAADYASAWAGRASLAYGGV